MHTQIISIEQLPRPCKRNNNGYCQRCKENLQKLAILQTQLSYIMLRLIYGSLSQAFERHVGRLGHCVFSNCIWTNYATHNVACIWVSMAHVIFQAEEAEAFFGSVLMMRPYAVHKTHLCMDRIKWIQGPHWAKAG